MDDYEWPLYYTWNGAVVTVEGHDGWKNGKDVAYMTPSHPTGMVPAGETHYLCQPMCGSGHDGWWVTEDKFQEHAEPLGPGAMQRETESSEDTEQEPEFTGVYDRAIRCPECDCYEFMVKRIPHLGLTEKFGVVCAECGEAMTKADLIQLFNDELTDGDSMI